jgi:AraC family transcriptional regulator, transcriptional activator of pobA
MSKEKILVYDICTLSKDNQPQQNNLLVERFGAYLERHSHSLYRAHRHSFYHLVLFTKGSGTHTIDFNQFKVLPYEIYFMIPGQVHSWDFEGSVDGYIINFSDNLFRSFLLNPNYLERFHFFGGISEDSVCHVPSEVQGKVTQLFEELLSEAGTGNEKEGDIDMIRLLLMQLFIMVERWCKVDNKKAVPQQKQVQLRNFRRLIDQHYLSIKLPKEYADLLYITPNHLNALCQDLLGKTAGELIRDRVILEAKRLLTNADMTITEIAYNLNFQDNSYFNRFFKKDVGVTPDEFRRQLKTLKL